MTLNEAKKILNFDDEVESRDDLFEHYEMYINMNKNEIQKGMEAFVIIYNYYNNTLEWAKKDFLKIIKLCFNEDDLDIQKSMKKLAEYFAKLSK